MSETYVITFLVQPGQRDRFLKLLYPVLDAMRYETSFQRASFHIDPNNENRFQLHETWTDREDVLNVQLKRPYRAEWHAALEEILEVPRSIESWVVLRAD